MARIAVAILGITMGAGFALAQEERNARQIGKRHFILEVKFKRHLPNWVKAVTGSLGLTRSSASKYALCVEAYPEIHEC